MKLNEFDAAIFDMDGTIMDSLGIWDKIDHDFLFVKRGISVPGNYMDEIAAMSFSEIADYTIARFNLSDTPEELMQEWTEMAAYEYAHNVPLKPFVKEYMEKLRNHGKKIILCTSAPEYFFKAALKNNGVYELFDDFANTCEAGCGKDNPKVYLLSAQKAGVALEKCMVFEDVITGIKTAKSIGMKTCGVYDKRNAPRQDELKGLCDYYIKGFQELLEEK